MHDHHKPSWDEALKTAEQVCAANKAKLTKLRQQVLEIVWASAKPIGAYQVLEKMRTEHKTPAPPTVYRALEFLLSQGLIHRVASLNAFVGCLYPEQPHAGQFLICETCGKAVELHEKRINGLIYKNAYDKGFVPKKQVLEVFGTCGHCH